MNNENNTNQKIVNNSPELNLMDDFSSAVVEEPKKEETPVITQGEAEKKQVASPVAPVTPTVTSQPTVTPVPTESPIQDIKVDNANQTPKQAVLTAQEKEKVEHPWTFIAIVFGVVAAFVIFLPLIFNLIGKH